MWATHLPTRPGYLKVESPGSCYECELDKVHESALVKGCTAEDAVSSGAFVQTL